jgi:putative SOS response-associated peptidase YedK
MCGRFSLSVDPEELQDAWPQVTFPRSMQARFNISPTQPVLAISNDSSSKADFFIWGLIPSWAKDPSIAPRLINARSETLAEKPSFRGAYKYHRCLILANGFYEWKQQANTKTKTPFFIHLKNGKPFAFAGLWDEWHSSDGSQIRTCTIITTSPNELIASIHDRMPVILPSRDHTKWLDPAPQPSEALQGMLLPYPQEEMMASPVSSFVNNPANEGTACIS